MVVHAPLFELKNIRKTYSSEEAPALDITRLTIPRNCLVAVIGYSGSGKTTLLNILGLLDRPDSLAPAESGNSAPEILFYKENNGAAVELYDGVGDIDKFRRSNFGFVFQEGYLLQNLTGMANIEIPLHVNGLEISEGVIDGYLKELDISDAQQRRLPSDISGGEAQRIGVVRSIVHSPGVILADEPSSNLDYDIGMQVMSFLKQGCGAEADRSVIWVTHNIQQASELADYVIILRDGVARGPYPNPKNEDTLLEWLRHGKKTGSWDREPRVIPGKPKKAASPISKLMRFAFSFAISDIFPGVAVKNRRGPFQKTLGVRNTQSLNMASLFMVILLTLLFLSISFAFKNYFVLSISDPRINRIVINGKTLGDPDLKEEDRRVLSGLTWARSGETPAKYMVIGPDQARDKTVTLMRPAAMGAFGVRIRRLDCLMNPDAEGMSMSGEMGVPVLVLNIDDPILDKIRLWEAVDKSLEKLTATSKVVGPLFLDGDGKPDHDKEGIVITRKALGTLLGFEHVPDDLEIEHQKAKIIRLPILGVVDWLPFSTGILVTEGWFLQKFWNLGVGDPAPGFQMIRVYVKDMIEDGLPVCNAVESMNYSTEGDTKATLNWIRNLTDVIFKFTNLALAGIWILAGSSLLISYAHAIKKKQKEIGVLMAKGITRGTLYVVFWIEILIIWGLSVLLTTPVFWCIMAFIKKFVGREFAFEQTMNVDTIFTTPGLLWPGVLLGTLCLALLTVFLGVRQVLKNNIATILRTGD